MAKYFTDGEFRKCIPSCSIDDMDSDFLDILDNIREDAGIPLKVNCAYRSVEWDKAKGRSGNSAHCSGVAVDVRCTNSANRHKIVKAAMDNGINRIGIADTFIHLDNSKTLPQGVIWLYD